MNPNKYDYIITGVSGKIANHLTNHHRTGSFLGIYHQRLPVFAQGHKYIQSDLSQSFPADNSDIDKYSTVIHTAACTHVDNCETDKDLGSKSMAWKSNVEATKNIVSFCLKHNKKLVFLSTESVFDGKKPAYSETDNPNPLSWYGQTKHMAEEIIKRSGVNYLIIRSVIVYGGLVTRSDMVGNMYDRLMRHQLTNAVVDQKISPTYVEDLADGIFALLDSDADGIFHLAGGSVTTPYHLARILSGKIGSNYQKLVSPVSIQNYFGEQKALLRLPHSVLDSSKYASLTGHKPLSISKGLDAFLLEKLSENLGIVNIK